MDERPAHRRPHYVGLGASLSARPVATRSDHAGARNVIFNVGEETTPTIGERLAVLPEWATPTADPPPFDFDQPLVSTTKKMRRVVGYRDLVDERSAMFELSKGRRGTIANTATG